MAIVLNHTIVSAHDKHRSARFFADLMGLDVGEPFGPFAPVRVSDEFTLLFDDRPDFHIGHWAFHVDAATFDTVLAKLQDSTIDFGSGAGPRISHTDRQINHRDGGRGVYVLDPDDNSYELITVPE